MKVKKKKWRVFQFFFRIPTTRPDSLYNLKVKFLLLASVNQIRTYDGKIHVEDYWRSFEKCCKREQKERRKKRLLICRLRTDNAELLPKFICHSITVSNFTMNENEWRSDRVAEHVVFRLKMVKKPTANISIKKWKYFVLPLCWKKYTWIVEEHFCEKWKLH